MNRRLSPETKRILGAVLIGLTVSAILAFPFCYALSGFQGLPINTCHFNETDGKTNQEIADLIDYPLVTLNSLPESVAEKASSDILYTDTGCLLFIRYPNQDDKTTSIQIMVDWVGEPPVDPAWKCDDYEASHQAQFHFKSVCGTEVEYRGKRYAVWLDSQFDASETSNWAQYLTVNPS